VSNPNATPLILNALAEVAGLPGFAGRSRALSVIDAWGAGLISVDGPRRELTDAGRQLLDEHSPEAAGWAYATIKADGTHPRSNFSAKRHHFTGRVGHLRPSACGAWVKPAGSWATKGFDELVADPRNDGCVACTRQLAKAAA
jgi:hypothetical protein